jgi:MFS family permease
MILTTDSVIGFSGLVVVLIGEMVLLSLPATKQTPGTAAGAVVFLFGHITFYASFIDATTYIYVSEIFPTHLRAVGTSISVSGLFLASLIFTQAASSAFAAIHWRYYILFTVLTFILIILLWLYYPETKGLSLEEVAQIFGDPVTERALKVGEDGDLTTVPTATQSTAEKPVAEHDENSMFMVHNGTDNRE